MTLRILAALVLALGLAACGGGGGSSSGPDTATQQRTAVETAIATAEARFVPLAGDPAEAAVKAASDAVAAAKKELTDSDALTDADRASFDGRIKALETTLASVRQRIADADSARRITAAEEARKIAAALSGTRITAIAAAVKHETPPVMSGTVPGTPAVSVADMETVAAGSAATEGIWKRGLYAVPDEAGALVDTIMLYTNIEPPGTIPFAGEGGRYGADNGLDADGNLPILAAATDTAPATDTTLITASGFPAGPGIREHAPGSGGTVEVAGSFDGAPGAYVCTPTADVACTSSVKSGGGYDFGGSWKFVPGEGATVREPDGEHQYFGWWLRDTGGSYAVGAFHGGEGAATDEFANLAALQGTATYSGPAAGLYAIQRQAGDSESGDFTATATLAVDFGDATATGTVTGEIDGFMVGGSEKDWTVSLGSAAIGTHGAIASGGSNTALTRWTIGDTEAETTGSWSGRFHEADRQQTPTVATGAFDAVHGTIGRMTGAFGAQRRP